MSGTAFPSLQEHRPARSSMTYLKHPPSAIAASPLLVGAAELGRLLSRSRASIRRDVAAGRIPPPVNIGRSIRWRKAEIEAWIAAGCPAAANGSQQVPPATN